MTVEITAHHYRTREPWRVVVHGHRVACVERLADRAGTRPRQGLILAPALCDIQVNGFAGVDLNAPGVRPADLLAVTRALARTGVAHYLPAIITGPQERMQRALATIAAAIDRYAEVRAAVPGIHLEGPYISPGDGARGAHNPDAIRPPDEGEFAALQEAAGGAIRLLTLAPEWEGAEAFIRRRVADGIVVALGHTRAGLGAIRAAIGAGARLSTHLGNGAEALLPRHENYVLMQLGSDELWASFIPDLIHLPPYVLKSFIRAKGVERTILTTDCMAAAGAPPGRYTLAGIAVNVGADRIVRQPDHSGFAGSALTLDQGVANVVRYADIPLPAAIDMASLQPLRLFDPHAAFVPSSASSFIVAQTDPAFQVDHVVREGVYIAGPMD